MSLYILQSQPSVGEQIVGGLIAGACVGIASWIGQRAAQKNYKHQVATQAAAEERLMHVAHQQRLQEITYVQQIETQKQIIAQREQTIYLGLFFALVLLVLAGSMIFILSKRTNKK